MIVELLTLGDELLDGRRVDTNTAWLGRRLTAFGAPPRFRQTTSDRTEDIVSAFRLALSRAEIVISTGGLGPTADDLTFEALAEAVGRPLEFRSEILAKIERRFREKGVRCPESNRRQAMLPMDAVELPNDWGTAPGCRVDVDGKSIFVLPGVPEEMENIFSRSVLPELEKRLGIAGRRAERTFKIRSLPESHVEEMIDRCGLASLGEIRIAYTASLPEIHVTLSALGDSVGVAEDLLNQSEKRIRQEFKDHLVAVDDETLESCVVEHLRRLKWRLATAESLTGGLVTAALVHVSGSSDVLERGLVTYSNASKIALLGVARETMDTHGAVSEACALEMARGAKTSAGVEVGLATTGIAGPTGGSEAKPVGLTYIAWSGPGFEEVRRYQFHWDRNRNRMLATSEALRGLLRLVAGCNPKM